MERVKMGLNKLMGNREMRYFVLFRCLKVNFNVAIILFSISYLFGTVGQGVLLPLYLSTFGGQIGAYFVLQSCSFTFMIVYGIFALIGIKNGTITREMLKLKWQPYLMIIGMFNAMTGILIVYSAFLSRVSGPLQSILSGITVPVTVILSRLILKEKYNLQKKIGVIIIIIGIIISFIPKFLGELQFYSWFWLIIRLLASIPTSLMLILQENFQKKYKKYIDDKNVKVETIKSYKESEGNLESEEEINIDNNLTNRYFSIYLLKAIESTWQWIFITLLFWTDIIPYYGLNKNTKEFWDVMMINIRCFFGSTDINDRCSVSGLFGELYMFAYVFAGIFRTYLTLYSTSNYTIFINAISSPLVLIFWFIFKGVNEWGGGTELTNIDLITSAIAIIFITLGILLYKLKKKQNEEKTAKGNEEPIYLCCGEK